MRYTVTWAKAAEQVLATLWNDATNRKAISVAANAIDKLLLNDPDQAGESREDGTRILLVPPLGVLYSLSKMDRTVSVLTVWKFNQKSQG
jgi:hypothetical protein